MDEKSQVIEIVEKFLSSANKLFERGAIDYDTYFKMTWNKKKFLKMVKDNKSS